MLQSYFLRSLAGYSFKNVNYEFRTEFHSHFVQRMQFLTIDIKQKYHEAIINLNTLYKVGTMKFWLFYSNFVEVYQLLLTLYCYSTANVKR